MPSPLSVSIFVIRGFKGSGGSTGQKKKSCLERAHSSSWSAKDLLWLSQDQPPQTNLEKRRDDARLFQSKEENRHGADLHAFSHHARSNAAEDEGIGTRKNEKVGEDVSRCGG